MLECKGDELRRQDRLLSEAYIQAMAALNAPQKNLLREAQRAWIAYRDTTCLFMARLGDRGTMASLIDSGCFLQTTAERARWLKQLSDI